MTNYIVTLAVCDCDNPDRDVINCEELLPLENRCLEEVAELSGKDTNALADILFENTGCDSFSIRIKEIKVTILKSES